MSTINVSNLVLTLQQKIDSSSSEADILYYSKAIQQLRAGNVYVVDSVSNLPDSQQNLGSLYYVLNDELVYFSSVVGWGQLYTTPFNAIFGWGSGNQLGTGAGGTFSSPVREFCSATDWCQVSAGSNSTSAIKTSGEIWGWGNNTLGRLGDGTATERCSPVREISSSTDWCQVSTGGCHTTAIKTSGELWSWGCNGRGALATGTICCFCSPIREMCSATDWCQVSAGDAHSGAIKTSGELWAWGCGTGGRLGNGLSAVICSPVREFCSATDWCQVSAGNDHTAAVKTSGELWVWGCSKCGLLGDGTITSRCSPVREFCSATDWCQVSSLRCQTLALKTSGQIWGAGWNCDGQLGDGTTVQRCSPVREFCSATDWCLIADGNQIQHSGAIKTDGTLWMWGCNGFSSILGDGTTVNRCSPVREFCSATDWCQVSLGCVHTIAIRSVSV